MALYVRSRATGFSFESRLVRKPRKVIGDRIEVCMRQADHVLEEGAFQIEAPVGVETPDLQLEIGVMLPAQRGNRRVLHSFATHAVAGRAVRCVCVLAAREIATGAHLRVAIGGKIGQIGGDVTPGLRLIELRPCHQPVHLGRIAVELGEIDELFEEIPLDLPGERWNGSFAMPECVRPVAVATVGAIERSAVARYRCEVVRLRPKLQRARAGADSERQPEQRDKKS